ncbi:stage II sporulation protein Q [Paraliobacillus ryukyuensis]|uniref:Stage II sporulation protein Q n=1 Tax=Paraliobacillus ryukyuensis TaxID=200904 RepID=A0A366EDR3_9BACI|nr:M23 family metallopeptidase [Paraliobacillus ryukyuensis]RBP00554.1 stage II sporulation protein Q [Paraliobacillus ryukyuensis]
MKEDNRNVSKPKWKRIFEKKWFFPAVYLSVAALMLAGVLWYQNLNNQIPEATDDTGPQVDNARDNLADFDQDSDPVVNQAEVLKLPVTEEAQTEIATKFYDYNNSAEEQEQALVLYDNKYYQSKGIDIASTTDKTFPVVASLSGEVTDVREDPMLGNVVEMKHENGITTHYASLDDVQVKAGDEVTQGEELGLAGENTFSQASGIHVHFEIRKDDQAVDPEKFINQSVADIKVTDEQDEKVSTDDEATTEDTSSTQTDNSSTVPSEKADDQTSNSEETSDQDASTKDRESSRATTNT